MREALATVLRDGTVARDRTTIYDPQLRIEKARRRYAAPVRLVWVRIRDRDRRVVHEVSVRDGSVTEHVVSEDASPSFSEAELAEGRRLLAAEPDLSRLLAESDVEIEWFNPGHGPERALGARFVRVRDHQVIESITEAVVDLDEGTVAEGGDRSG